jgi:hypothetical protein
MFDSHITGQLASYLDGELPLPERQRVERHLAACEVCRIERDQVRSGMSMMNELPRAQAPDTIWAAIKAADDKRRRESRLNRHWVPVLAAFAIVVVAGAVYWISGGQRQSGWEVVGIQGSTAVGSKPLRGVAKVKAGEWIETGSSSSAKVQIGEIGVVEIGPGTRLRVAAARPLEHRLTLARGEIHAKISAPPKLFFVDTASATAEDLGCEYSLKTDEDGSGLLRVTLGWVSFQWRGLESLVPGGASCRTRPQTGPGVPYFDDAPEELSHALETLEAASYAGPSLDVILRGARIRDTLTLWHLITRTGLSDRERIYDRIAALSPVPPDITREKVLQLDSSTLTRWREDLAWKW